MRSSRVLTGALWRLSLVASLAACGDKDIVLPPIGVGIDGDSLTFADGAITMIVPESAVTENVQINVTVTNNVPAAPTLLAGGGLDITVTPAVTFLKPITVRISYQDADIPPGVNESEIGVYRAVNGAWQKVAGSTVNAGANQVEVSLTSFSTYGVLGAPVASVTVTPNPAAVQTAQNTSLTAIVEDAEGNDLSARAVTWASDATAVATVTPGSGAAQTATANGVGAGTATITATSQGVSGTTTVNVSAAPPPPPPGPHNEPAGYTAIVERPFNSKATSGADRGVGNFPNKTGGAEGWDGTEAQYPLITVQNDPTAPNGSPFNVFRFEYTAGTIPAGVTYAPGTAQTQGFSSAVHGGLQYRKLYVRFWFKLGNNFQNHPSGMKLMFFRSSEINGLKFEPIIGIHGQPGAAGLHFNLQGTQDNPRGDLMPNTGTGTDVNNLQINKWYKVEVVLEMNSAFGTANGILRAWLDGVQVFNYTDIRYLRDANPYVWGNVHIVSTWGGQGGTINNTWYWFLDHLYASGAP